MKPKVTVTMERVLDSLAEGTPEDSEQKTLDWHIQDELLIKEVSVGHYFNRQGNPSSIRILAGYFIHPMESAARSMSFLFGEELSGNGNSNDISELNSKLTFQDDVFSSIFKVNERDPSYLIDKALCIKLTPVRRRCFDSQCDSIDDFKPYENERGFIELSKIERIESGKRGSISCIASFVNVDSETTGDGSELDLILNVAPSIYDSLKSLSSRHAYRMELSVKEHRLRNEFMKLI